MISSILGWQQPSHNISEKFLGLKGLCNALEVADAQKGQDA